MPNQGLVPINQTLQYHYTQEDYDLIKQIIAPPGTPDSQIKIAIAYAKQLGLDPFRKQVMVIKTRGGFQVVVGVHGVGAIVNKHHEYRGTQSASVYAGEEISIDSEGRVTHTYNPSKRSGKPLGSWATTARQLGSRLVHFTIYLRYDDYVNLSSDSWQKQPAWMIEKTARMFSMRAAFPDQFSNIYAPEEFGERSVEEDQEASGRTSRLILPGERTLIPVDPEPTPPSPKPWELPLPPDSPKGSLGTCGCGSDLVKVTSKATNRVYLQCSQALEEYRKTKDKSVFEGHQQTLLEERNP